MRWDEGCAGDWAQWQGSGLLSPALSGTLVQATHVQGWARSPCHRQSHCHVTDVLRCGSRGNWGVQVLVLLQVQPRLECWLPGLGGTPGSPPGAQTLPQGCVLNPHPSGSGLAPPCSSNVFLNTGARRPPQFLPQSPAHTLIGGSLAQDKLLECSNPFSHRHHL